MRILNTRTWFILLPLLLICSGCASSGPYPVRGKLKYDDDKPLKELAGFQVTFTSESLGKSARGDILEDGTFRLTSEKPDDGAYPGEYKVIVSQPHPEPDRPEKRRPVVDLMYEDPERTDLKATVTQGSNDFTFRLKRIKSGR